MAATLVTKEDGTKTHVGLYSCETYNELNKVCNINANVFVVVATGEMSSLLSLPQVRCPVCCRCRRRDVQFVVVATGEMSSLFSLPQARCPVCCRCHRRDVQFVARRTLGEHVHDDCILGRLLRQSTNAVVRQHELEEGNSRATTTALY